MSEYLYVFRGGQDMNKASAADKQANMAKWQGWIKGLAEEAVQDALCRALEVWKFQGPPEKPGAWLMEAARRRAIDVLRRERTRRTFAPDVTRLLETEWTLSSTVQELFSEHEIRDDELRMMFSCCHPQIAHEGQVALVLNLLCGFGVREIAAAFLTGEA